MTCQASAATNTAASNLPPLAIVRSDASGDHRLTETDLRVLIYLSARANARYGSIAYPSVSTVADDIKVDDKHVRKSIHKLVEFGYLTLVGTYPSGTKIHKVIRPGFEIRNGETILNPATPPGGICHPPLAESATQTRKENKEKKLQPPNPRDGVESPEGVVVVFSPSASTAAITQEPPQAAIPTKAPISQPTPLTANSEQHGPTVGIVNGITVQAKPISPNKVEPIKTPAPKNEPAHPPAFHYSLTRAESATIMVLMAVLPLDLQAIVMAEFIIQLNGGNVRRPVGYVRKLIEVAKTGGFVPSASREAANRAEMEQNERTKAQEIVDQEKADRIRQADEATKLSAAMDAAGPERIAELRLEFIQHLKKTNKMAYGLYQADGFNSVGFEILFQGFLREKLQPIG